LTFGRWSDSGDQTHTITITPGDGPPVTPATSPALTVYTANFIDFELFTLTVTPTGAGTVTTTPPAQTFAAYPGRQYLRSGQPVTLQANAAAGYQFLQWSGIETPSSENPITRTYAQFVGVQFVTTTNPVYTFASNPVGEWVYLDGAFTWVPQNVSPDVTSGWGPTSVHTLSADASEPGNIYSDTQNTFLDWSDGGALSHSITLPAASKTYTADFDRQYPLFLSTGCGGSATTAPSSTSGLFDAGSTVSLSATPTPGWFFAGWTGGDVTGTTNPIDVTMNSPHYAAATFNATAAPLTITGFSPSTAPAGGAPFTLTIVGTGFTAGTQVSVNYSSRSATLVDSSHITVSILTSDLVAGGIPVSVSNVSPDNSCSNYSERPYLVSLPASVNSIAIKAGNGQSATVNQPFLVALQALVTDSSSKPVAGAPVVFTAPASGASGTFVGSLASVTVTTDSSGTATAPTFTANGTAGSYSVTAAVGTASVSFSLTNTAVVTGGGPVSDDFHSATLNTSLWTFINPEGDGQYTMTGIELQLTVPAGTNHDPLTPSNQSVRVVQSIPNQDFGIEVKFDSVPVLKYQMEGVLVEQDASNYLRFEFSSNGSSTSLSALSVVNGVQTTRVNIPVTFGTSAWMRVIRSGSSWTVEWTGNGTNFIAEPAFTQVLNVARTGPYAGNYGVPPASPPAFFALVDYFFNMASPIVPEDGGPPVILNKQPTVVGPTTAIFTFNTDVSSIGTVTYGLSAPTGNSVSDTTATTTHSLTLTNLTCATTYHYVISATAGGQTSSQPAGTFTTGACLQAPVADTFNVPQLNTAVWSVESSGDPISAGTVSENGTELVLSIPAAVNHDPFVGGDDALRVVQTIANADFRVEAKFDSIPTKKYQIEGITVEQDQRNYLRFEISSDGTSASVAAASIVNSAQTWWFSNRITLSGPSVWLRVSRTGSSWTLAWSASGTSFTTAGTFTQSLQAARIGPYAGNYGSPASAAPAFAASVDYFNNAFGPVVQNVQPDDFDDYAKSNTLWTYVNPVDNAGLVFNGTDVYITALGHANHDPFAGGDNSARLVQPVSNPDFNVELKFDSLPTLMYQMEGLLVEQDGTNYVRFEVSTDGTTKHLSAAVVLSGAQTVKLNMPVVLTGSSVWMRVARAGANWTLTRSADGNTYSAGVSFTQTLTVNRLGPYAGNYAVTPANAPEFMIAVDYIHTLP
jgi:regulation of enolase protein 1 (concanavalin A-like superfamily)